MSPPEKIALLVFANTPQEEVRCKPMPKNTELFESLTHTTLQKARNSGLAYYHITENQQEGNTFGERFTNAIQGVFNLGFEKVIAIGNDTPHLRSKDIKEAAEILISGKTVLGPSLDGGFYLLGISKDNFDPDRFTEFPWQQVGLFRYFVQWLADKGVATCHLPALQDVDGPQDVPTLVNRGGLLSKRLKRLLVALLERIRAMDKYATHYQPLYCTPLFYNKGSPAL